MKSLLRPTDKLMEYINTIKLNTGINYSEPYAIIHVREGDKVLQTTNNYDKEVFNGDIGRIKTINVAEKNLTVHFDTRKVVYDFSELDELTLAYAITIHKSQGSEFPVVVMPLAMQQYLLLQRNLLYTGLTRGRRLVMLLGQKKAFTTAVHNASTRFRYGGLFSRLKAKG